MGLAAKLSKIVLESADPGVSRGCAYRGYKRLRKQKASRKSEALRAVGTAMMMLNLTWMGLRCSI